MLAKPRTGCAILVLVSAVIMPRGASAETPSSTAPPPGTATSAGSQKNNIFAPRSAEEAAVQNRITIFNSAQRVFDESFDAKLRVCRGC
jgi:hypothetical protein